VTSVERENLIFEAELSVVGAVLSDSGAFADLDGLISENDFSVRKLGVVFRAARLIAESGNAVDELALCALLERAGKLDEIGGRDGLRSLWGGSDDVTHVIERAGVVRFASRQRQLRGLGGFLVRRVDVGDSPDELVGEVERALVRLGDGGVGGYVSGSELVVPAVGRLRELAGGGGAVSGVGSGFPALDEFLGGFQAGNLYVLAARPSMGKTALMLEFGMFAALDLGLKVVIHSLEMDADSVMSRMLASRAQVDVRALRLGYVSDVAFERVGLAAEEFERSTLLVDDTSVLSVSALRSRLRREAARGKIDLVLVDYLQLMSGSGGGREENRAVEVSRISRELKLLARELSVPIVVLSQLNRAVESRKDRRPMLSDLRDSGSIEQDADVVMFVYRDDYYERDSVDAGVGEVIIAKQRNGATGVVRVRWLSALASYRPLVVE
jgi:replicative DNA helicase